jgi:hypothetical protein
MVNRAFAKRLAWVIEGIIMGLMLSPTRFTKRFSCCGGWLFFHIGHTMKSAFPFLGPFSMLSDFMLRMTSVQGTLTCLDFSSYAQSPRWGLPHLKSKSKSVSSRTDAQT